jgi:hypothetical protein
MGRTACTEPQCLYNGDLYLYLLFKHITMQLKVLEQGVRNFLISALGE